MGANRFGNFGRYVSRRLDLEIIRSIDPGAVVQSRCDGRRSQVPVGGSDISSGREVDELDCGAQTRLRATATREIQSIGGVLSQDANEPAQLWSLPVEDLQSPTPLRVRDLIVECFVQAQRETFARGAVHLGRAHPSDADLRRVAGSTVRAAFREVGAKWDQPSPRELTLVVKALSVRAAEWGTSADVVQHHIGEIARLITACR